MIVVIYANCQGITLSSILSEIISNCKVSHIQNYTLIVNKEKIPYDIIKKADVFIYQPIDSKHMLYSTDTNVENNILSYLKKDTLKISFPYIYNSALWLFDPEILKKGTSNGDIIIGNYNTDKNCSIKKLKEQGHTIDDIINLYKKGNIDFNYKSRFENSIKILKEKEKLCDIKVCDFIVENISKHKLFYTQNHPTIMIFTHCINQLMPLLGFNKSYDVFKTTFRNPLNNGHKYLHTSYDKKFYNFEYNEQIHDDYYIPIIKNIYHSI